MARSVAVLGAGIVGISCALHLHRRGFRVTLIDRGEPGSETSFGNSGVIGRASIAPLSQPAIWRKLPRYAANRDRAVRFGPGYPARELGWFVRFLANSRPGAFDANARHLNALLSHALSEHEALLAGDSGCSAATAGSSSSAPRRASRPSAVARAPSGIATGCGSGSSTATGSGSSSPTWDRCSERADLGFEDIASVADPGRGMPAARRTVHGRGRNPARRGSQRTFARLNERGCESGSGTASSESSTRRSSPSVPGAPTCVVPARLSPSGHPRARLSPPPRAAAQRAARPALSGRGRRLRGHPDDGRGIRLTTGIEFSAAGRAADPGTARLGAPACPARRSPSVPRWSRSLGSARGPEPPTPFPSSGARPAIRTCGSRFGHASMGFALGPVTGRLIAEMLGGEAPLLDPAPYADPENHRFPYPCADRTPSRRFRTTALGPCPHSARP